MKTVIVNINKDTFNTLLEKFVLSLHRIGCPEAELQVELPLADITDKGFAFKLKVKDVEHVVTMKFRYLYRERLPQDMDSYKMFEDNPHPCLQRLLSLQDS